MIKRSNNKCFVESNCGIAPIAERSIHILFVLWLEKVLRMGQDKKTFWNDNKWEIPSENVSIRHVEIRFKNKDKKQKKLRYSRPTEPNLKLSRRIRTSPPLLGFVSNQPWETCADFSVVKSTRGDSYVNGPLIKRAKNWTRSQFAKCQCERKHFSYAALWWHMTNIFSLSHRSWAFHRSGWSSTAQCLAGSWCRRSWQSWSQHPGHHTM